MTEIQRFCDSTRRGLADARRKRPKMALAQIQAARRLLPNVASLALAAGDCYEGLGDLERARKEYARALSLDPDFEPARTRLQSLEEAESVARQIASQILGDVGPLWGSEESIVPPAHEPVAAAAAPEPEPQSQRARHPEPVVLVAVSDADSSLVVLSTDAPDVASAQRGAVDLVRLVTEARDEALEEVFGHSL